MNREQRKQIRRNAKMINVIKKRRYSNFGSADAKHSMNGALIGGGIGVLIAVAMKRNIIVGGIMGLVLGRFIFKID